MDSEARTHLPEILNEGLKHDWELLDRYQAFSAELVRMSLTGIGAIGFLVASLAGNNSLLEMSKKSPTVKWSTVLSLAMLGLSAAAALIHRFVSSDSMAYHISLLRLQLSDGSAKDIANEKKERNFRLKLAGKLLLASGFSLVIGAVTLAVTFIAWLWRAGN